MKKFSLVLAMLMSFVIVEAHGSHYGSSSLTIKLWNNTTFNIMVDNELYPVTSNFNLAKLSPGIHSLKIIKKIPNRYGNGGMKKLLYNGTINIPKNSNVIATITPNRNINVKVIRRGNHNNNHCSTSYYNTSNCGNNCCVNNQMVMSNHDFEQLLNTIEDTSFDDDKLVIVEQALNYNMLTSEQVAILLRQVTFESNRLELAKKAFHKTIDKHNYYLINNEFTFSSTINDLNFYIQQYS